jgi:hypothetical protein
LDTDTEQLLKRAVRESGASFKAVLNDAVRKGLASPRSARPRRFVQKTYALEINPDFRLDKALAMAGAMEDEALIRKMSPRK